MRQSKILLILIFFLFNLIFSNHFVNAEYDDGEFDDSEVVEDDEEVKQAQDQPLVVRREKPTFSVPNINGNAFFSDAFESISDFEKKWVLSQSKKDGTEETIAKYDGIWALEEPEDNALLKDNYLVLKSKAKHHAISAKLSKDFVFSEHSFVVQYEVKFQEGQECGGAYIKLLSKNDHLNLKEFNDKTGYTIMFGPDKCGNDHKLHFIFRHKNPKTNVFEEKHAKKPSTNLETYFSDKKTHLYTLVLNVDNTFAIYIDQVQVNYGSLLEDMSPAVNPPTEIVDPNDKKPDDWDEREKIKDPDSVKPDDWDESEPEMIEDENAAKPDGWLDDEPDLIPDPNAEKPSDWDEDMDGEWEAPMINNPVCESGPGCGKWKRPEIKNPKYKGIWTAPMIDNPDYKGKWIPKMIPNPDYFEDKHPFKMTTIGAIGLELWSMSSNIAFDNFIITDSKSTADDFARQTWNIKQSEESLGSSEGGMMQSIYEATNEKPWLWAVIVVVVVLPFVLLIAYCCSSSKEDQALKEHKKKDNSLSNETTPGDHLEDDEVEPDSETDEENEAEAAGESVSNEEESNIRRRTKSDLEDKSANNASPRKSKKKSQRDE